MVNVVALDNNLARSDNYFKLNNCRSSLGKGVRSGISFIHCRESNKSAQMAAFDGGLEDTRT
jgi:hypothetical protein